MTNTDYFKELLNASLTILASDAEAQISWLQNLSKTLGPNAEVVDELALDFNDAFTYARQLRDSGHISQAVYDALAAIDKKLDQMSGHENTDLWCFEGLRHRSEWRDVRCLAQQALSLYRAEN